MSFRFVNALSDTLLARPKESHLQNVFKCNHLDFEEHEAITMSPLKKSRIPRDYCSLIDDIDKGSRISDLIPLRSLQKGLNRFRRK